MKEHNYSTLRDALDRLPDYGADAGAWGRIVTAMSPPLRDRLPAYRPPAAVWNQLSQQLDAAPGGTPLRAARRRWPRLAVAATVALLLGGGAFFLRQSLGGGPQVSYAYHQEVAAPPVTQDWNTEEESFTRIAEDIASRDEPRLNTLYHELTELTAASQEIKAILTIYGNDPGVVRQLAEIERDRSDIYRQIIAEI